MRSRSIHRTNDKKLIRLSTHWCWSLRLESMCVCFLRCATSVYFSPDFKFHPHLPFLISHLSSLSQALPIFIPPKILQSLAPYNPEVYGLWVKSAKRDLRQRYRLGMVVIAFGPFINTESSRSCILCCSAHVTEADRLSPSWNLGAFGLNLCHSVRTCAWTECKIPCVSNVV